MASDFMTPGSLVLNRDPLDLPSTINALPSHGRDVAALVQGFPEALDLVRTNLALGVCVACAGRWDTLRGDATELTVRLLRMRRREACAALVFRDRRNGPIAGKDIAGSVFCARVDEPPA